jgi:hypothetical protein
MISFAHVIDFIVVYYHIIPGSLVNLVWQQAEIDDRGGILRVSGKT